MLISFGHVRLRRVRPLLDADSALDSITCEKGGAVLAAPHRQL